MQNKALSQAFEERTERFLALDAGISLVGWQGRRLRLLEIGCAVGDGANHLSIANPFEITAVDKNEELICRARERYCEEECLNFLQADATRLPFLDSAFDGIYSEAAFSVIQDKEKVVSEYARVLKTGGRVLVMDFVGLKKPDEKKRESVKQIPCLMGIQTAEVYQEIFEDFGFQLIKKRESLKNYADIVLWLCKVYGMTPAEIGRFLVAEFGGARDTQTDFISSTGMTYCTMIFEKR